MKNKKIFYIILCIILLLIILIGTIIIYKNINKNNENNYNNINIEDLPNIMNVDYNNYPMMYDFLYSAAGYKKDDYEFPYEIYYILCKNKNYYDNIFIEMYNTADGDYNPLLGSNIINVKLENKNLFDDYCNNIDKNNIIDEGDWIFYIIKYYDSNQYNCLKNGYWGGINFDSLNFDELGKMADEIINQNLGWPMEWLRRDSDKIELRYNNYYDDLDINFHYNLNYKSNFWDKYPVSKKITLIYNNGDKYYLWPLAEKYFYLKLPNENVRIINEETFNKMID